MTKFEKLSKTVDKDVKINKNKKLFISSYKKFISDLEDKILNKEIELEEFFNKNFDTNTNSISGYSAWFASAYKSNLFDEYLNIIECIEKLNKTLAKAKSVYTELFTETTE